MDEVTQEFQNIIENDAPLDDGELMNELFGDDFGTSGPRDDEAEEAPERTIKIVNTVTGEDVVTQKPKRVLLKLDLDKLFSDRGLSAIPSHIKPLKLRGKGHELDDITKICRAYEHWAHRLYPKMTFKDVLEKVEHLGLKNRRKCYNKKMEIYEENRRMAVITRDSDNDDDDSAWPEPEVANDSGLFGTAPPTQPVPSPPKSPRHEVAPPPPALTAEQIERMRLNRLRAMERRKQRESGNQSQTSIGVLEISPLARPETPLQPLSCSPSPLNPIFGDTTSSPDTPVAKRFKKGSTSPPPCKDEVSELMVMGLEL